MALDHHTVYASAKFRKLKPAEKWATIEPDYKAFGGNMSALAFSVGYTRKSIYTWKAAYDGIATKPNTKEPVPRAWGRQSILAAKRLVHRLPIDIDKAVFSSGDIVVLLALIAGERDALDQLPELLREPLSALVKR